MTATVSDEDRAQAEKVIAAWERPDTWDNFSAGRREALLGLIAASIAAERERCWGIANAEAQGEALSADRARAMGRTLVSECRRSGHEVASRIADRLRARDTGDNR